MHGGVRTHCASRRGLVDGPRRWLFSRYGRGGVRAFGYLDLGRAARPAVSFERVHPNQLEVKSPSLGGKRDEEAPGFRPA